MTFATRALASTAIIGAFVFHATPGLSAPPVLSGAYAYSATMACQSKVNWTTGNAVRSVTSGPVLTGATNGTVIGTVTMGQAVTGTSGSQAVTSVDFAGSSTQSSSFVAEGIMGSVVVDGTPTNGVIAVTNGTGLLTASSAPVLLSYHILGNDADVHEAIGTLTFDAATHKATLKQTKISGPLMRKGIGTPGDADSIKKTNQTIADMPFTNTAAGLTLNGDMHNAVYANIVSGVAHHVNILRLDDNGCAFRATLVYQ